MANLRVRAARIADAYLLAPHLRAADLAEAAAMDLDPLDGLADGIISSHWACTVDLGQRPIAHAQYRGSRRHRQQLGKSG